MTSTEIRKQFLEFFEQKEHHIVRSAPVVPQDDPTLLFTNAGMNQFKDVFLGVGKREYKRAADTQKCIRVSGKHNDLEEVGHDTYHHTFFEMLGNWSFGDYYKTEAISWAWELLTDVFKLPKERLWVTVYRTDQEALDLWKTKTDINPIHILKFDEKDNFWEMGETGPCGPCSEIHINISDDYDNPDWVNAGKPECIEIWNLVFIQYNRDKDGVLHDLPAKHVDTGMGFERLCAVMQGKNSNYDSDVFTPIINEIAKISGVEYKDEDKKIAMRVIADHIRTLTFAITDGAVPSNEGRGYVLRRILRRAARYGRKLNLTEPFLYKLVDKLVELMGEVFTEIKENSEKVKNIIHSEENSFHTTLDRGIDLFEQAASKVLNTNGTTISGEEIFKLYDTFGFPVDLTNVMAKEKGLSIDETGFEKLMEIQKERARKVTKDKLSSLNLSVQSEIGSDLENIADTIFTGYNELTNNAEVLYVKEEGNSLAIILNKTPFYAESGGQVEDFGYIEFNGLKMAVKDLVKTNNKIIHLVDKTEIIIKVGDVVKAVVDDKRRWDIMRNHSATHLLHKILRTILGTHVQQAGSYVGPDRLRFDFSHFEKVTSEQLLEIEKIVNEKIREHIALNHHNEIPYEEAKKMGALMFFGDKYGDKVNVVQFGDFSMEFCGGTHVKNSSQIGIFKILTETSIASGVRRIEAITGAGVEKYIHQQAEEIKKNSEKIAELNEEKRKLEKELADYKFKEKLGGIDKVLKNCTLVGDINVFKGVINAENMDELKLFGDELRNKIKSGVGVLFAVLQDKVGIVCVVTDDLIKNRKLSAGKIVGELAKLVDGGGGGKPHLATAGGKSVEKIDFTLSSVEEKIKEIIG
ncbi:MAG: alanine--tRNA ligase [bacterium]